MAFAAAASAVVGAAGSLAGGFMSSKAAKRAARRAKKIARLNERDFQRQAVDAYVQSKEDQRQLYWQASRITGAQAAVYGATNRDADFGSAALVVSETERLIGEDAAMIAFNADRAVKQLLFQGKIARKGGQAQAANLKAQGIGELVSGIAGAAGSSASAYSSYKNRKP